MGGFLRHADRLLFFSTFYGRILWNQNWTYLVTWEKWGTSLSMFLWSSTFTTHSCNFGKILFTFHFLWNFINLNCWMVSQCNQNRLLIQMAIHIISCWTHNNIHYHSTITTMHCARTGVQHESAYGNHQNIEWIFLVVDVLNYELPGTDLTST